MLTETWCTASVETERRRGGDKDGEEEEKEKREKKTRTPDGVKAEVRGAKCSVVGIYLKYNKNNGTGLSKRV